MKKIFIILLLALLSFGYMAQADTETPGREFYYLFHLYYDNGQLVADRDFKYPYDIIPGEIPAENLNTQFPYRGEIVSIPGDIVNRFTFDPKQGDTQFVKGKVSVKAPYAADALKAVFFDGQNQSSLTISLIESSFCNDDGICNSDRGEDSLTCAQDCQQTLPTSPVSTPTATTGSSSGIIWGIIYSAIGIVLLGILWWLLKGRGRNNTFTSPASPSLPQTPPATLPTPPPPPGSGNTL